MSFLQGISLRDGNHGETSCSMGNILEIGFEGERVIRDYLNKISNCQYGQIDVIAKIENKWYSLEIKKQEMFTAPPFDGHGLPPWQVDFRLKMHKELGIIPVLFVVDKTTGIVYYQNIDKLNEGEKFITKTGKRIIYPLINFKILSL